MNDARIARARIEGNVKGQRWLEVVHTMAERVRRRAAHGVGECAEMRRHFIEYTHTSFHRHWLNSFPRNRFTAKGYITRVLYDCGETRGARVHPRFSPQPSCPLRIVDEGRLALPVKRHRGEPGHTRDTRDTRTHKGTQTNLTTGKKTPGGAGTHTGHTDTRTTGTVPLCVRVSRVCPGSPPGVFLPVLYIVPGNASCRTRNVMRPRLRNADWRRLQLRLRARFTTEQRT